MLLRVENETLRTVPSKRNACTAELAAPNAKDCPFHSRSETNAVPCQHLPLTVASRMSHFCAALPGTWVIFDPLADVTLTIFSGKATDDVQCHVNAS